MPRVPSGKSIRVRETTPVKVQFGGKNVERALLPVSPRLTGRSARSTFFDSARKLVSGCLTLDIDMPRPVFQHPEGVFFQASQEK